MQQGPEESLVALVLHSQPPETFDSLLDSIMGSRGSHLQLIWSMYSKLPVKTLSRPQIEIILRILDRSSIWDSRLDRTFINLFSLLVSDHPWLCKQVTWMLISKYTNTTMRDSMSQKQLIASIEQWELSTIIKVIRQTENYQKNRLDVFVDMLNQHLLEQLIREISPFGTPANQLQLVYVFLYFLLRVSPSILERPELDLLFVCQCVIGALKRKNSIHQSELCQHICYKSLNVFSNRPTLINGMNMCTLYYIAIIPLLEDGDNYMIIRKMLIGWNKDTLLPPLSREGEGILMHQDNQNRVKADAIRSYVLSCCCRLYLHHANQDVLDYIMMMYNDGVTYGTVYEIYETLLQPGNYLRNVIKSYGRKTEKFISEQKQLSGSLCTLNKNIQTLLLSLRTTRHCCECKLSTREVDIQTNPCHIFMEFDAFLPVHVQNHTDTKFIVLELTQTKKEQQVTTRFVYMYKFLTETHIEMECLKSIPKEELVVSKQTHRLYPTDLRSKFEFKYRNTIYIGMSEHGVDLSINDVPINLDQIQSLSQLGREKCKLSIGCPDEGQGLYTNGIKHIQCLQISKMPPHLNLPNSHKNQPTKKQKSRDAVPSWVKLFRTPSSKSGQKQPIVARQIGFNEFLSRFRANDLLLVWLMAILNRGLTTDNPINLNFFVSSYLDLVVRQYQILVQESADTNVHDPQIYSTVYLLCLMHFRNTSRESLSEIPNSNSALNPCSVKTKKNIGKLLQLTAGNQGPESRFRNFRLQCLLGIKIGSRSFLHRAIDDLCQMDANELTQFLHYLTYNLLAEVLDAAVYTSQFLAMVHNLILQIYHRIKLSFEDQSSHKMSLGSQVLGYTCCDDMNTHIAYYLELIGMASEGKVCRKLSEERVGEIVKWAEFTSSLALTLAQMTTSNGSVQFTNTIDKLLKKVSALVFYLLDGQNSSKCESYEQWRHSIINHPDFNLQSGSNNKTTTGFASVYRTMSNLFNLAEEFQRSSKMHQQSYFELIGQQLSSSKNQFLWDFSSQEQQCLEIEVFNIHCYMLLWNHYFAKSQQSKKSGNREKFMYLIKLNYPVYNLQLFYRIVKHMLSFQIVDIDFLNCNLNNFGARDLELGLFHRLTRHILKTCQGDSQLSHKYLFLLDAMSACDSALDLNIVFDFKNEALMRKYQSILKCGKSKCIEELIVVRHICDRLCSSMNSQCPYPSDSLIDTLFSFVHRTFQISEIEATAMALFQTDLNASQSEQQIQPGGNKISLKQNWQLSKIVFESLSHRVYTHISERTPFSKIIENPKENDFKLPQYSIKQSKQDYTSQADEQTLDTIRKQNDSLMEMKVTEAARVRCEKESQQQEGSPRSTRMDQMVVKVLTKMQQLLKKEGMQIMHEYHRLAKNLDLCEQNDNQLKNKPNSPTFSSHYGLYRLDGVTNKYRAKTLLKKDYADLTNDTWAKVPKFDSPQQITSEGADNPRPLNHVNCAKDINNYYRNLASVVQETFSLQRKKTAPQIAIEIESKKVFNVLLISASAVFEGILKEKQNYIIFREQCVGKSRHFNDIIQTLGSERRTKDQYLNSPKIVKIPIGRGLVANPKTFLHQYHAIQFFTQNFSYFFVFRSQQRVKEFAINYEIKCEVEEEQLEDKLRDIEVNWMTGLIRNFEFLMEINNLAGRSINDLSQYYVFPWTVFNFDCPTIDQEFLNSPANFRNLKKSIGALNEEKLKHCQERYRTAKFQGLDKFLFGSFYSNPSHLCNFLVRVKPFTEHHFNLQGGTFDYEDRLFTGIESEKQSVLMNQSDMRELIPQFYSFPEFLRNRNKCIMINKAEKTKNLKKNLGKVKLPKWVITGSPEEFIFKMRQVFESDLVTRQLRSWIDLIFGYKSKKECAINYCNLYHPDYYPSDNRGIQPEPDEKHVKFKTLKEFGQVPNCIFKKLKDPMIPHEKGSSKIVLDNYITAFCLNLYSSENDSQMRSKGKKQAEGPILTINATLKQWILLVRRSSITICLWLEQELKFTFGIDECSGEIAVVPVDLLDSVLVLCVNGRQNKVNTVLFKKEKENFVVSRIIPVLQHKQHFLDGSLITGVSVASNKILVSDQNIIRVFAIEVGHTQSHEYSINLFNNTIVAVQSPTLFSHISLVKSVQVCSNSKVSVSLDYSNYVTVFTIADRLEIRSIFNITCFHPGHQVLPKFLVHDLGLIVFFGLSSTHRNKYEIGVYNYYGDCVCVIDLQMSEKVLDFQFWDSEFSAELLLVCHNCIYQIDIWNMYELGEPINCEKQDENQQSHELKTQVQHRKFKLKNQIKQSKAVSKICLLQCANRPPQKDKNKMKKFIASENKTIKGISIIRQGLKWVLLVLWSLPEGNYNQVDMLKKDGDNKKFLTRIYRQNMSSNYGYKNV